MFCFVTIIICLSLIKTNSCANVCAYVVLCVAMLIRGSHHFGGLEFQDAQQIVGHANSLICWRSITNKSRE